MKKDLQGLALAEMDRERIPKRIAAIRAWRRCGGDEAIAEEETVEREEG